MNFKLILAAAAIVGVAAAYYRPAIEGLLGGGAPADTAGTQDPTGSGARKTLTPSWPPATDQAVAVSKDLLARNYYVVLDGSGSMKERACSGSMSKMDAAKVALAAFAESVPADVNLGLEVFDATGVREWLPLGPDNRDKFISTISRVQATGGTPLRESVELAYAKLLEQGRKQLGYGEYHLVIVTDGEANAGHDPTLAVNAVLDQSPIIVSTIGFCISDKHSLNQPGRTIYRAADNPDALRQGLADVLAEAPKFTVTKFR